VEEKIYTSEIIKFIVSAV